MIKSDIKIVFFGTPKFAAVILEKLIETGYAIPAVFTQPDKKAGRKHEFVASPVKELAIRKSIKIFQPDNFLNPEITAVIENLMPDLIIVAAFGKLLPKKALDIPRFGCINVHASLLPKWRGASPIQNAVLCGEKETGVTLMLMNEKIDEGEIIVQEKTRIEGTESTESLSEKLSFIGSDLLIKNIPLWIERGIKTEKQDEKKATYCRLLKKEDGKINWNDPAEDIYRRFLAFRPWPGIWTEIKSRKGSKRLKLIEIEADLSGTSGEIIGKVVKCEQGAAVQSGKGKIVLKKVQLEGKEACAINDFLRGNKNFIGSHLG